MKRMPKNKEEFAIILTGGKQYKVAVGDSLVLEKLPHKPGDTVTFDKVLLVDNGTDTTIGAPFIDGAQVVGRLEKEGRKKKVTVLRYKAKSRYKKTRGHRQPYHIVTITEIK